MKRLLVAILPAQAWVCAEVKIDLAGFHDRRDAQSHNSRLSLQLNVEGPEISKCKALRIAVTAAKDDAGNDLSLPEERLLVANNQRAFNLLTERPDELAEKRQGKAILHLCLANPPRTSKTAKIEYCLELLFPENDPPSVIIVDPNAEAGKILNHPILNASRVRLRFSPIKDRATRYEIHDPQHKVAAIEYCSADGTPLKRVPTHFAMPDGKTFAFATQPPAGTVAKIYLNNPKSVQRTPIRVEQITLP